MFLSNRGDEPLLGPPFARKRISGPSNWSKFQNTLVLGLCVLALGLMGVFMLSADTDQEIVSSAKYLEAPANLTTNPLGDVAPDVIYGMTIFGGVLLGFFGYRFIRAAFFVAGFTIGLVVFFDIGTQAFRNESWIVAGSLSLSIVGAILLALLTLYLYRFGVAVLGVLAGIGFGAFLGSIFFIQFNSVHPEIPMFLSMACFGIFFGLVAFFEEKPVVILCTSFLGSFFMVLGAGNFIGQYPTPANIKELLDELRRQENVRMPGAWWAYFAVTLVLWIVCIAAQVQITANGVDHSNDVEAPPRRPPRPPQTTINISNGVPKKASFKVERGL
ncbi:hypothetical protein AeMF1_002488 [Aphanomyces euteiches]|nr:hypothetical protein AeMF1_002488 [Aphanomyces euteiches]KAH9187853.1 hypothetical protein AeNC1_010165 [Aphanomyces euteiches]